MQRLIHEASVRIAHHHSLGALALLVGAACGQSGDRSAADTGAGSAGGAGATGAQAAEVRCDDDNGGLTLPDGFCASVFADDVGGARHVAVAENGDVFVALQSAPAKTEQGAAPKGGILALRDADHDGKAEVREAFGDLGGTGVGLHGGYLYADAKTAIVRYQLPAGSLKPSSGPDTIVSGIPTGGHAARNFAIGQDGSLYVNFGSMTNSCQQKDRQLQSRGVDPCVELDKRAGIWRFDANRKGQTPTVAERYATGIRNAVGLAINPADQALYATQHGRDQLFQNWPKLYDAKKSAEQPREQLMRVARGDDYGWPYCYFDGDLGRLVLAPEYGGNAQEAGRCAQKKVPLANFPGHWAPNALAFYDRTQFPQRYRNGAFIAFHGSWNRAPLPQAGYNVAFQPMSNGQPAGEFELFAQGFPGDSAAPGKAKYRPSGLAVTPDGALLITDDQRGRIWRVAYRGADRASTAAPEGRVASR
jgi:glucose/arabinose dehydrogenase